MGEFAEHYRQKAERHRFLALCARHAGLPFLTFPHVKLAIAGSGDECVWCGTDDHPRHVPADYLVDMQTWPRDDYPTSEPKET